MYQVIFTNPRVLSQACYIKYAGMLNQIINFISKYIPLRHPLKKCIQFYLKKVMHTGLNLPSRVSL